MQISIIIPTYNRPSQLKACIASLSKQQTEFSWEVIVVDDGGTSDLTPILNAFEGLEIHHYRQENAGPAMARNNGVNQASGEFLIFLDDDCEPHPSWLNNLFLQAGNGVMVGGKTVNKLGKNLFSEASQLIVTFLMNYFKDTPWFFFTSNNFMVDRSTFLKVGGFDRFFRTSAGEDRAFAAKWIKEGNHMLFEKEAVIYHSHSLNLISFFKLHFKYGTAANTYRRFLLYLQIPLPHFTPALHVKLISHPWFCQEKKYSFFSRIMLSFLLILSQAATFLGYLSFRYQSNKLSKSTTFVVS